MRSLRERFRHRFAAMARDPPGERFVRHYERIRRRGQEHPLRRATLLTAGGLFVLAGVMMIFLPGPGLLFTLIGLTVIAARARRVAEFLDRGEVAVRARFRRRSNR